MAVEDFDGQRRFGRSIDRPFIEGVRHLILYAYDVKFGRSIDRPFIEGSSISATRRSPGRAFGRSIDRPFIEGTGTPINSRSV